MNPISHLIFGTIFAFFLYLIAPHIGILEALLILSASVLIDIDHYFYYLYKEKEYNLWKLYLKLINKQKKFRQLSAEEREKYYSGFFIFHGIEVLAILFLISYFFPLAIYIFIGFAFHLLLDYLHQTLFFRRVDKVSLIRDFYKFKKLQRFKDF